MEIASPWLALVLAYALGSLSFAVIVSRLMGLSDPRHYGSGNPGATNVLRSGNKLAAILTLVFDALKGVIPVLLAQAWQQRLGWSDWTVAGVGLAAFVGHLWPVFFRFQGGKGVATAAGVILALHPLLGGLTLLAWLAVAAITRYSSLAALSAAVFAPVCEMLVWEPSPAAAAISVMSLLLIWRHAANIRKLLDGTESKLGQKAKPAAEAAAAGKPPATSAAKSSAKSTAARRGHRTASSRSSSKGKH